MNKNHPLDGVFRQKLRDFEANPPMHLWEQISEKRNRKHRFVNQLKQRKPLVGVIGLALATGIILLAYTSQQIDVDAFPIPMTPDHSVALNDIGEQMLDGLQAQQFVPTTEHKNKSTNLAAAKAVPSKGLNTLSPQLAGINPATFYTSQEATAETSLQTTVDETPDLVASNSESNAVTQKQQAFLPQEAALKPELEPNLPPLVQVEEEKLYGLKPGTYNSVAKCADFSADQWSFFVDVMASPDFAFRTLEAADPELEAYVNSRNESERWQYAFSGSLRLSMVSDNGMAIRTGINYSQINEKFTYFNGTEVITTTKNVYNSEGEITGVDTVVEIGARYKVSHNRYQMLDIPFLLGYEFDHNKLRFSANAGAYLNLLFKQRGDLLSPHDLAPVSIDSSNPDALPAFKQQVGLGWYGSLGIAYQLNYGTQLLVEPHFKIFPKSVTQGQFGVNQRYATAGIFIGVRKQL